jgi:RimJ/RimL family protein N-acetyltransferase
MPDVRLRPWSDSDAAKTGIALRSPVGERSVFAIVAGGEPVGNIGLRRSNRGTHEFSLHVLKDARRQGIGRAAVHLICGHAAVNGAKAIELVAGVENTGAHRLAERCGFHDAGKLGPGLRVWRLMLNG